MWSAVETLFDGGFAELLLVRGATAGDGGRFMDCSFAEPTFLSLSGGGCAELLRLSLPLDLGISGERGVMMV